MITVPRAAIIAAAMFAAACNQTPKEDPRVAELMKTYNLALSEEMAKEGYALAIGPRGIVIGAESDRGLLYGATTLRQMLASSRSSERTPASRV